MPIQQVELSNTFNEFRQTVNSVTNTVNELTTGTNTYTVGRLNATNVETTFANTSNLYLTTLTAGRLLVSTTGGQVIDDAGLLFNSTTNQLSVDGPLVANGNVTVNTNKFTVNATTGATSVLGPLTASNTVSVTGNLTLGSGANNAVYYPANGSLILTSNGDAAGTGVVRANHLHADWHVGAGGDLETWATAKNDNADTHHVFAVANTNSPIDMMVVNQSEGNQAYAEFIAIHATGNTTDGWVSMGVNSTNYADGVFGITKADDAYLLYSAPVGTTHSGDLVIGTSGNGTGNKIILSANGFDDPANNAQMTIHPGQKVVVSINTQSSNTTTGALVVNGGIGLQGNLNVGGNVAITGTITLGGGGNTVSTSSLTVDNPMIFVGANNAADTFDLGIVGEYTSSGTKYNGLVRDASDSGKWKLFSGISNEPANTVNFTGASYDTLYLGGIQAVGGVASTSNTTGTIIVTGGVGVSGRINAGGAIATTDTTSSSSTTTGALVVAGGAGIAGQLTAAKLEVTKSQEVYQTLNHSGSGTLTIDFDNGNIVYLNQGANITGFTLSNAPSGKAFGYTILRKNTSGTATTITWGSAFKWPDGGTTPSLTGTLNSIDMFTFVTFDGGTTNYSVKSGTNFA